MNRLVDLIFKMIHLTPSSDTLAALSYHEDGNHDLNKQENSFIRESTKYWVHPNDIIPVLITIGKNLPLYCFGDDPEPATHISSIYFDNFQRECYQARLLKTNGARILRLRTYGQDHSKVYVERKVHYEKWTGDTSSKDRFVLKDEEILPFLKGQPVPLKTPQHTELFHELQTMVQSMQLHPVLRINYNRLAFQSPDHDHIRISIDLNMKFFREHTSHLEWYTDSSKFTSKDILDFPYAVVEIKLRDPFVTNRPQFIVEMEESSLLHKQNFFSKYLHAAYSYGLIEGTANSLRIPPWWSLMKFTSPQFPVPPPVVVTAAAHTMNGTGSPLHAGSETHGESTLLHSPTSAAVSSIPWVYRMLGYGANADRATNKVVKVEPKVFFANERTFLSWFNSALFTGSVGIALTQTPGGRLPGGLLLLSGLIIIGYSILTYLQRTFSLVERKPTGYHDLYGPIILSVVIITVFVLSYFL
jgi:uncharacterized membrane protein YidH (DUF202 family)